MSYDPKSSVLAALNHAARTFSSFDATDWRAMAEHCAAEADRHTCVDCGQDQSLTASLGRAYPTGKPEHRLVGKRWACGVKKATLKIKEET